MGDDEAALSLLTNTYAESAGMIAQTVMKFYNSARPYLFVIDDIQKITRAYISLLRELDDQARERNCPIYYLFTLNEEETSLDELLLQLNWDRNYQNREYRIIKTTKFRKKDILAYIKTRYGLDDIDSYFDGFDKEISPLKLHTFFAGLQKERIIARIPGDKTYQIICPFQFSDKVQQLLYGDIPLKNICNRLAKGEQAEFLLKYLYIADAFTIKMVSENINVLYGLIDHGILREKDGAITFYHDKIRVAIGKELLFTEEDYADIFADADTDDVAKAICALEQIGHLRNGAAFLERFFASDVRIGKREQRHQICKLVIQYLTKLASIGLCSAALQFVRMQFPVLREEQGYKTFFAFLKHIADSVLERGWDIDEECTENVAFFIKKFFDCALSTHNDQYCSNYFEEFIKIFKELKHISESRRNFWLAHYTNRAAIALDRKSAPLVAEPAEVKNLYELSEFYSRQADNQDQLILQITVDNFNRHYVYRHDLAPSIISDSLNDLCQLRDNGMTGSIVLDYHVLLLECLSIRMIPSDERNLQDLLYRVRETRQRSDSAFYIIKLYFLEITILASNHLWSEANKSLSQALAFAYKKDMRSYIYTN